MIDIYFSDDEIKQAKREAKDLGSLRNSITKGAGNVIGILGEIMCEKYIDNCVRKNTRNYDLIINDIKADVKTKRCTSQPRPYYDCSIANYNVMQKCDIYIFCRVFETLKHGWLLGWENKNDYFNNARFLEKGEIDPSNNFTVKADCYNVAIQDLQGIQDLCK